MAGSSVKAEKVWGSAAWAFGEKIVLGAPDFFT